MTTIILLAIIALAAALAGLWAVRGLLGRQSEREAVVVRLSPPATDRGARWDRAA